MGQSQTGVSYGKRMGEEELEAARSIVRTRFSRKRLQVKVLEGRDSSMLAVDGNNPAENSGEERIAEVVSIR